MHKAKAPIYKLSCCKTPKHNKFKLADKREKPVDIFVLYHTGVDFSSHNNFAILGSFAKFLFLLNL